MIKQILIPDNTIYSDILFFKFADLTQFSNRVVPLFGPNGVGKSTFLDAIEKQKLDIKTDKPTLIFAYQNSRDNFKIRKARTYSESFDPRFINARLDAQAVSEGQSIIYSMFDLLDGLMKNGGLPPEEGKDMLILLDEIDSGMSIDNIDTTMRKIKYLTRIRPDLQFIFSFNSPRVLKHFSNVLSMYDGTMLEMRSDDDMLKVINTHKKAFDKVRKNSKGRPKVFD